MRMNCVVLLVLVVVVEIVNGGCPLDEYDTELKQLIETYEFVFSTSPDESDFHREIMEFKMIWDEGLLTVPGFEDAMTYLSVVETLMESVNTTDTVPITSSIIETGNNSLLVQSSSSRVHLTCNAGYSMNSIEWYVGTNSSKSKTTMWYMLPRDRFSLNLYVPPRNSKVAVKTSGGQRLCEWNIEASSFEPTSDWVNVIDDILERSITIKSHKEWIETVKRERNILKTTSSFGPISMTTREAIKGEVYERLTHTLIIPPGSLLSLRCNSVPFVRYKRSINYVSNVFTYSLSLNETHPWFDFEGKDHYVQITTLNDRLIAKISVHEYDDGMPPQTMPPQTFNFCEWRYRSTTPEETQSGIILFLIIPSTLFFFFCMKRYLQ